MFTEPTISMLSPALLTTSAGGVEIDYGHVRVSTILIPAAASSITTLTYYAAEKIGGTYLPLNSSAGQAVTQTVSAGNAYDMPSALFGCAAIKIVANAAGSVFVTLKG